MHKSRFLLPSCLLGCAFIKSAIAIEPSPLKNAYWRFEEGTPGMLVPDAPEEGGVLDITGNGNHLRREADQQAPLYVTDVPASTVPALGVANQLALRFGGFDHFVYTADKSINNCLTTAFTIEVSFKADSVGNNIWQAIICRDSHEFDPTSEAPVLSLKIRGNDGRLMFQFRDINNQIHDIKSTETIEPNRWYHAAISATSTQAKFYLNSNDGRGYVLQGTADVEGGAPLFQGTERNYYDVSWRIGRGMWSRLPDEWFTGVIDEVRLSNVALSPSKFLWAIGGIPGDLDGDSDVDAADGLSLRTCVTGPGIQYASAVPAECPLTVDELGFIDADLDKDRDVDQSDFAIWQRCYRGSNKPGDPDCNS